MQPQILLLDYSVSVHVLNIKSPSCFVNRTVSVSLLVPCAPQSVKYSGNRQSAVLSWDASVFATKYIVYNMSGGSRVKLCNTTKLSCQLSNFDPDATEVTASNEVGESNPSQNITGQTQHYSVLPTQKTRKSLIHKVVTLS